MAVRYENIDSQEPATKGDLEQLREDLQSDIVRATENLATKEELAAMERRFLGELNRWGEVLFEKIDAVVENRFIDLGAAKTEQVEANTERLDRHEARIDSLEREAGTPR